MSFPEIDEKNVFGHWNGSKILWTDRKQTNLKKKELHAHSSITFVSKKSGKFHFWMATAPGTNMLSTNFWLTIVHPVWVKTYRSLKIKFFVKVKNKVHVTIGHVCDFARNYGPAQNDFKVKILWCVMEFCIEQYTHDGQHINNFIYFVWNSIVRIVWSRLWHFGVTFGSRLWHFWYRSCAHSCTNRKASQFLFWKYFSSTK